MRNLLRQAGSPEVTLGLVLSLALWYLVLVGAGSLPWGWSPFDLGCFRAFAVLLFVNLAAGAVESLSRKRARRVAVYLAALFAFSSGAHSYLYRFEGTVGLAEGEAYEPIPPAFRSAKKGPLARIPDLAFTLTRVERDNHAGRVEIVQQRVAKEIGSRWERIGDSEIRFLNPGVAPLVTVTSREKGELERSYVKLELDPPGKVDSFNFDTLPYDFYLSREKGNGAEAAYQLNVRRGKLSLFEGRVVAGQKVPVQSVEVSIPDERKFALLAIRNRSGHRLFLISLAIFALALLASLAPAKRDGRQQSAAHP